MKVFLKPGELYISDRPTQVSTILGSCIAVTIFSTRLGIGGICHALLPKRSSNDEHDEFRYVESAITHMLRKFDALGVEKHELEVKLLGGADVLERIDGNTISVGKRNVQAALETMKSAGIRPVVCDVGGTLARKVHFYTHTGKVLLKRIERISEEAR